MERARHGDIDAFGRLVGRHRQPAVRVAYAIAGADAEDAVQDGLLKAHAALGRFRSGAPFRPWLIRIVANEARNRRRSAGRRNALALRLGAGPSDDRAPSPEDAAELSDRRRLLLVAVADLPDRDREVIACRWFAGLSESETAEVLGCRPGTVKSRSSRALDRLRAMVPVEALR